MPFICVWRYVYNIRNNWMLLWAWLVCLLPLYYVFLLGLTVGSIAQSTSTTGWEEARRPCYFTRVALLVVHYCRLLVTFVFLFVYFIIKWYTLYFLSLKTEIECRRNRLSNWKNSRRSTGKFSIVCFNY